METLIRNPLVNYLKRNGYLSKRQFGFISGRSTTLQLLRLLERWTEILDLGGDIDVVYCDFMKTFNKVPHKRLLQTLEHYGIQGVTKDWIKDFLKNRKQRVVVNGTASEWQEVTSGIPQGSVLGPILFVIYINTLPEVVVSSDMYLFADDVAIFRAIFDNNDTDPLQKDLNRMDEWTEESLLKFNYQKCSTMRIGRHYETKEYTMGHGTQIFKRVEEEIPRSHHR